MKFKYLIIFFSLSVLISCAKVGKAKLLCDVYWRLDYIKELDNKIVSSPDDSPYWTRFRRNGILEDFDNGKIYLGSWRFSQNQDSILLTDYTGMQFSAHIDILTSEKLQFTYWISDERRTWELTKTTTLQP